MRVDGVLQGSGEELARGVADHDVPAYVGQPRPAQVDRADADTPRPLGELLVARGDRGQLGQPLGAGPAGRPALDALVLDGLADRLRVRRQVAAEPVGEGGGVLGDAADDHGQLPVPGDEPGRRVGDVGAGGQRLGVAGVAPRRALLEDADGPARRHQRPGELLGELEEGLDRADHEQPVAQEADQLAGGQLARADLAGAQPDQQHQEAAGEQHPDRLDPRLPLAGRDARLPGRLRPDGVVAPEGALASDAAQDPQARDDVGGERGELGVARSLELLAPVERAEHRHRHADQRGRGREDQQPHLERRAQHDGGDGEVGDQLGRGAGQDLGHRPELVGVAGGDAEHLAGRRTPGQDVAHLHRLAGDQQHRAVDPDQPAPHDQGVHRDPEHRPDHRDQEQQPGPEQRLRGRPGEDALVDGASEQPGAHRQRQLPQHADDDGGGDDLGLAHAAASAGRPPDCACPGRRRGSGPGRR